MKVNPFAILAGAIAGVLAVGLATVTPSRPKLHAKPWSITESSGTTISPGRPLDLPVRYGDFDLRCRIELPKDADLDILFRKVEHWGEGHMPLFHARFSGIRVSTRKDGPGLMTREELLFEPDLGGVRVAAGSPASVELSCRGYRVVRANVNGIDLPGVETTDDFGNLALVSRDGVAVVHDFEVTPWPAEQSLLAWLVGGGAGAFLGLLIGLLGASPVSMGCSLLVFAAGGFLARSLVWSELLPAVEPSPMGVVYGAMCLLPFAIFLGLGVVPVVPRLIVAVVLGTAGAGVLLEFAAREQHGRFAALEDDRLDLVFGPQSGAATFDAVTRMLKCRYVAHTLEPKRYDVLLLGGKQFFDAYDGDGAGTNVGVALPVLLKSKLRLPVDKEVLCAAIPTEQPNSYQQFAMFADYYRDYRPKVVVLGLCSDEDDAHTILRDAPRALAKQADEPRESSGSVLWDVWQRAERDPRPQTGEDLRATLEDLHNACQSTKSKLVLVLDNSLSKDFQKVVLAFAGDRKVPFVTGFAIYEDHYPVELLAETLVRELVR